jgi:hypothetical protein
MGIADHQRHALFGQRRLTGQQERGEKKELAEGVHGETSKKTEAPVFAAVLRILGLTLLQRCPFKTSSITLHASSAFANILNGEPTILIARLLG